MLYMAQKRQPGTRISIFNTFKTNRSRLTGEARRQREIISILAGSANPQDSTRAAIAKSIATKARIPWKNMYSGIFRDFDQTLVPMGLVREEGRLPMKRGPKALQDAGVPYYGLTQRGMIVALGFDSINRKEMLNSKELDGTGMEPMRDAYAIAPRLVLTMLENYVKRYATGEIDDVVPFDMEQARDDRDDTILGYRELLTSLAKASKQDRNRLGDLLGA